MVGLRKIITFLADRVLYGKNLFKGNTLISCLGKKATKDN